MKMIVNKDISVKKFALITILAVFIGISLIYIATEGFIKVNILKTCKKEEAKIYSSEIVETVNTTEDQVKNMREISYTYDINNNKYEGTGKLWWKLFNSDKNFKVGDEIKIFYEINNPEKSKIYHISYGMMILGIIIIVLSVLMLKRRIEEEK